MINNINLKNIFIKKSYSSDNDDILNEFYVPVLANSIEYNRLAGFFSSSSLAISAKGITGLINNSGVMKMIASPQLNENDLKIIIDANIDPCKFIEKKMLEELENFENEIVRDHVFALGWLIANKKLEIKVALVYNDSGCLMSYENSQLSGIFHQKVGILKDSNGNMLSFSGSINESALGWLENIEEFKVFRNWVEAEKDYVQADIKKFNIFWNNCSNRVRVIKIPDAVEKKLIRIAPIDISKLDLEKYCKRSQQKNKVILYQHQREAINSWIKNNFNGIFEMATGTGKTYAALGCLNRVFNITNKAFSIITCPYNHLLRQWKREIDRFGIQYKGMIIADSSNPSWKNKLTDLLIDFSLGNIKKLIILTTHNTFSSKDFIKIIQNNKGDSDILLIADEVHNLGAEKNRTGLIDEYTKRLGLSATPKRWFDEIGTHKIYDYFGGVVYEFGLEKAINRLNPTTEETYLTPFRYVPKFVSLTYAELEEYVFKTKKIIRNYFQIKNDTDKEKILENIFFQRANIIKNALKKYSKLTEILDSMESPLKWTLIYCNPKQIDEIMNIINKRQLIAHRFTMDEGVLPSNKYGGLSQREFILQKFEEGDYQILVAMKCLDEGIDIPQARKAILMASSGNPREYIQRIGRIIRRHKSKREAIIYDIVVIPSFKDLPQDLMEIEWKIFQKEIKRYEEISRMAINSAEALKLIFDIKNKFLERMK